MTRHSSAPAVSRGFTLVEMLLVLALMGILAGAAVPIFRHAGESHRLPMAASTLAETVRYARSTCVSRGARGKLTFDPATMTMQLDVEADPLDEPGTFQSVRLPYRMRDVLSKGIERFALKQRTPKGLEETTEIKFFPDGRCIDTFVYLYGKNQTAFTIAVVGISGQVMVFNYETETYYEAENLGA